ncbi:uncharacterized protein GGS22DRAFT_68449 [Annulohypoxylon maeteangense]|uniref:uncharacterized protein n=1 Tax=Annulohypoxylon maeteangense TaxID=1927788 RepID=UPI00200788EE|nr:uncharacterized protein GGS22DRAFT_68449 [Annulohypoxylon maeteangense]KAI0889184.1 hypothetical protein GGS22DRAFT_68449 [Annulohypoxylon maeteangense]
MEADEVSDQFFTYDGRLESFKSAHPAARRSSHAKGKGPKTIAWPHEEPNPVQLAHAGLFFEPTPDAPDNTVCFLCVKAIAGWESSDSPLEEHLRLSPHCGWAIVAAIDVGLGDYAVDDPKGIEMTEARKATFAGRWPHDGKRGWKCKTKQLVDAGWKYTPTVDSDDMVSCTYCSLALDGWEPKDDPYEEHYRRSPGCQFFKLLAQYKGQPKKKGRGKGARASQSSRLSAQSIVSTAASDVASMLDNPVDHEDSVMTTTSVMTQGGTKRSRAKKGTAAKGKKTRAKKEAPVEVLEDEPEAEEELPPPPPPKPTRGRKRASDTLDDSVLTAAEAPATKKRATRARKTNTADVSVVEQDHDLEMADVNPAPKSKAKGRKGKATTTRKPRNVSGASTISTTSQQEDAAHAMDDEELDRQLEADLDRPLSDDENIAADSDSDRKKAPVKPKGKKATTKKAVAANHDEAHNDHAMFDPEPPIIDETAVDAELQALETEMEVHQDESLQVPKKGRKAGTRKTSKQTTKKARVQEPVEPEPEPEPVQQDSELANEDELAEGHDVSTVSNATIVRTSLSSSAAAPKKRGRPSKKAATASSDYAKPDELAEGEARVDTSFRVERRVSIEKAPIAKKKAIQAPISSSPSVDKPLPLLPVQSEESHTPATPKPTVSPAQAARQPVISPSPSPQSSDAENEPPSSKPSNTSNSNRVALAPVAATPVRTSPSKRNVLAGLQSTIPWTSTDVEMVFEDLDKENTLGSTKYLKSGTDLTSPEKQMTVEQWIYHNAEEAQQKLKLECETMVSAFEREGTRALQALEGLVID